jgi:TRAP-type C4-dicarboxylate transport system permease small subunit
MTWELLLPYISYCLLILFSGILLFFSRDKCVQGMGYIIGMTVMVALLVHYVTIPVAFVAMIILILFFIFCRMERNHDDASG